MSDSGSVPTDVTLWLSEWREGDASALDRLLPLVYDQLRRIAARQMRGERSDHTLQPTELVHEAFMRLVRQNVTWQSRAHFYGVASEIMRRLLVDHARKKQADKRGAGAETIVLDERIEWPSGQDVNLVVLDECLTALAALDPQQARVIELRFFAGLSIEDVAEVLGVSPSTVKREWRVARAWLLREMQRSLG